MPLLEGWTTGAGETPSNQVASTLPLKKLDVRFALENDCICTCGECTLSADSVEKQRFAGAESVVLS